LCIAPIHLLPQYCQLAVNKAPIHDHVPQEREKNKCVRQWNLQIFFIVDYKSLSSTPQKSRLELAQTVSTPKQLLPAPGNRSNHSEVATASLFVQISIAFLLQSKTEIGTIVNLNLFAVYANTSCHS